MKIDENNLTLLRERLNRITTVEHDGKVARDTSPSALIRYELVPRGPQRKSFSQIFCRNARARFLFWIRNKKNSHPMFSLDGNEREKVKGNQKV